MRKWHVKLTPSGLIFALRVERDQPTTDNFSFHRILNIVQNFARFYSFQIAVKQLNLKRKAKFLAVLTSDGRIVN